MTGFRCWPLRAGATAGVVAVLALSGCIVEVGPFDNPRDPKNSPPISKIGFRDSSLRDAVTEQAALSGWSYSWEVTSLNLDNRNIIDLTGVDLFIAIEALSADNNLISDLGPLQALATRQQSQVSAAIRAPFSASATPITTYVTTLSIANNFIEEVESLAGFVGLRTLDLSGNAIIDVTAMTALSSLVDLNLANNLITDVTPLAQLASLRTIDLSDNAITTGVAILAQNTNATSINLSGASNSGIPPEDLDVLEQRVGAGAINRPPPPVPLSSLSFTDAALADAVNAAVSAREWTYVHEVTELDLSGAGIVDLTGIEGLLVLTSLDLSDNQIVDVSPLAQLTRLRYLDLSDNRIETGVNLLTALTNAISIDLSGRGNGAIPQSDINVLINAVGSIVVVGPTRAIDSFEFYVQTPSNPYIEISGDDDNTGYWSNDWSDPNGSAFTISVGDSVTAGVSVDGEATFTWYLDGAGIGTGELVTFGSNLEAGPYELTVVVEVDGRYYSESVGFTVGQESQIDRVDTFVILIPSQPPIAFSGQRVILVYGRDMTVTASMEGAEDITWYLDGVAVGAGTTVTVGAALAPGPYELTAVLGAGTNYYSQTIQFLVRS